MKSSYLFRYTEYIYTNVLYMYLRAENEMPGMPDTDTPSIDSQRYPAIPSDTPACA